MLDPKRFTLGDIASIRPCRPGWNALTAALEGTGLDSADFSMELSIGDIALTNGYIDAMWLFMRMHDRNYAEGSDAIMREMTAVCLPIVKTVIAKTSQSVAAVAAIDKWAKGGRGNMVSARKAWHRFTMTDKEQARSLNWAEQAIYYLLECDPKAAFESYVLSYAYTIGEVEGEEAERNGHVYTSNLIAAKLVLAYPPLVVADKDVIDPERDLIYAD